MPTTIRVYVSYVRSRRAKDSNGRGRRGVRTYASSSFRFIAFRRRGPRFSRGRVSETVSARRERRKKKRITRPRLRNDNKRARRPTAPAATFVLLLLKSYGAILSGPVRYARARAHASRARGARLYPRPSSTAYDELSIKRARLLREETRYAEKNMFGIVFNV